jgi:hypothetical protein
VRKSELIRYAEARETEKPIYLQSLDGRWKQEMLDRLEKDFERLSRWHNATEAERQAERERITKNCDGVLAIDWSDLQAEHRRELQKHREGRRLPEGATYHERLAALADRLDISTSECGGLQDGKFLNDDDAAIVTLLQSIGVSLIFLQPEFWTLDATYGAGRPTGAKNKQIKTAVTKEAVRQRRRRQKKRDKYSR